jgi:thiamine phosphate synthase YjbQ (UPF0047 family)
MIAGMRFHTEYLTFRTKNHREYINITPQVDAALAKSGIAEGMILVSAMHITAGASLHFRKITDIIAPANRTAILT